MLIDLSSFERRTTDVLMDGTSGVRLKSKGPKSPWCRGDITGLFISKGIK